MCKTDSQWEAAIEHRELSSVLCDDLEGWEGEAQEEGTCVYVLLVIVQQRLTQHCHAIILQLKKERDTHHVQVSGIPCPAYLLCHH